MADPQVLHALRDKAHDLRQAIVTYEESLDQARHELAVVICTLALFERDGGRITDQRPAHIRNLFKRGEALSICLAALSAKPEGLSTRDLAIACLGAREFDHDDPVLIRAMTGVLSNTLKKAERRGSVARIETGHRQAAWRLNGAPPTHVAPEPVQHRRARPA